MTVCFTQSAWADYLYFQQTDKKLAVKINSLIKDITRAPFDGIGKPEPLKYDSSGLWSRRIDLEHRLVYQVTEDKLIIHQCRYHY
jgi:toxin YoeB